MNNIGSKFNTLKKLAKDPEYFLINNYQRYKSPTGFRLELFIANKYNLVCHKLKWLKFINLKRSYLVHIRNKGTLHKFDFSPTRHSQKTFCPYCEKTVIPVRLYKLDAADIVIILFTAGLWAIFLFVIYLFLRRCPVCNYNLRGFKHLSETKINKLPWSSLAQTARYLYAKWANRAGQWTFSSGIYYSVFFFNTPEVY